jgi:hypothetical protein
MKDLSFLEKVICYSIAISVGIVYIGLVLMLCLIK